MSHPRNGFVADILDFASQICRMSDHDCLVPKEIVIKVRSNCIDLSLEGFFCFHIIDRLVLSPIVLIWICWQTWKSEIETNQFLS